MQDKVLTKIDTLKGKLLGTDRDDHWYEVLSMEEEAKKELLTHDLTKHKGMKILLEWMMKQVKDANELLIIAKSNDLTDSQRDGLIERKDFIMALIDFLDPKGTRIKELERELDYQLADDDEENI